VVALRGNHEDGWLRVIDGGWPDFVAYPANGCLATLRSFRGATHPARGELPAVDEVQDLLAGSFFPPAVVDWMRSLPWWYEDDHAIYVHAGVPAVDRRWQHPSEVKPRSILLWTREAEMFAGYRGKTLVVGHTVTKLLPPELSSHTPADPTDLWAGENVIAIDTACGKGGFLTAIELPRRVVYESRCSKPVLVDSAR
jgi:serine/threonine protein phosphatase 1